MSLWIKLAAIFLIAFTLYDVSVPETCMDDGLAITGSMPQIQSRHREGERGACQFEEDCLACAHIIPGTHFVLSVTKVVSLGKSDLILPTEGGIPARPYHPPRA